MAITQAVCASFKKECLDGLHLSSHTYKAALYTSAATLDAATTSYTGPGNEVPNGAGYTTGGATLAGRVSQLFGTVAVLDWTSPTWPASTITARGMLIYNDTLAGKNAVMVINFGGDITSTAATFTAVMPTPGAATSLIQFA